MTSYSKTLTLTRTADTNAYTAGDVVGSSTSSGGAVLVFDDLGPGATQRHMVTSTRMLWQVTSVPSGATSFRLQLYNASPPSALADNAAWDLPSGDWSSYMGYVDLGTPADAGAALYCEANILNKQIAVLDGNIYGYLVTNGGFTPASGSVMMLNLQTVKL